MPDQTDVSGRAALSICEALLLAMNDHEVLSEAVIMGVLRDAAASHENAPAPDEERETHLAIAKLINLIIDNGNSVRRR